MLLTSIQTITNLLLTLCPSGVQVKSEWSPSGVQVESEWTPLGLHLDSGGIPLGLLGLLGLHSDSTGIHLDSEQSDQSPMGMVGECKVQTSIDIDH